MALVATKNKYHVALDGEGLILQGVPDRPAYIASNAPVYGTRFASGDRDYNDLSQWWYFIQTDWSAGFKDAQSWEDDSKFYYSANIDAFSKVGSIRLMRQPTVVENFEESIRCGLETSLSAGVLSTPWKLPTANNNPTHIFGTAFSSVGFGNWSNPTNAYTDNGSYATASQGGADFQEYSGFGFAIPSGATIVGFEVRMDAACTQETGESGTQIFARLMKDATAADVGAFVDNAAWGSIGSSRSFPSQPSVLAGSHTLYTQGGASDSWGTAASLVTAADVNDSKFGLYVSGNRSSSPTTTNYSIDYIEMRVFYRVASTDKSLYIGTANENGNSQPIIYASDDDGANFSDISTAEFTNSGRIAFVQLTAPFGVLWAHTMTQGTDEANIVNTWDGDVWTDQSAYIAAVNGLSITPHSSRASAAYGGTNYMFIDNLDEGYALVSTDVVLPTAAGDYDLMFERAASLQAPIAACEFEGSIYYLVGKGIVAGAVVTSLELRQYDIANDVDIFLKEFKNVSARCDFGSNNLLINTGSSLLVTVPPAEIWELQGGALQRIFKADEVKRYLGGNEGTFTPGEVHPWLRLGGVVADNKVWWGNLIYDPVQKYFFNGFKNVADHDDYSDNLVVPICVDSHDDILYFSEFDISELQRYDYDRTTWKTGDNNSSFLIFSLHDKLQSIDKLLHMVTLGFEPFDTGETLEVYYSTLPTPSTNIADWTNLGAASNFSDGSSVVFKNLLFPSGTTAKKVWFRIQLFGDGTSSPELTDFTLEYLPIPDYKKQWTLNANLADELKTLDGSLIEKTAREMKSRLEKAWWTKSQLDFQDVDFASTALTDSPLTNSATTVNVSSTNDFPEQGRIRIEDEEILYTGKTPKSFTGCIRGARGTKAVPHNAASVVHNGFKVLVLGVEGRIPTLLEGKHVEYTFGLSLREV